MKITLAIISGGDGSAYVRFFENEKTAEACMEHESERLCDDVYTIDLPLDKSKVKFYEETEPNTDNDKYFTPVYWEGQLIDN